jgi:hypothetical protein
MTKQREEEKMTVRCFKSLNTKKKIVAGINTREQLAVKWTSSSLTAFRMFLNNYSQCCAIHPIICISLIYHNIPMTINIFIPILYR